jgi:hypothetical protein
VSLGAIRSHDNAVSLEACLQTAPLELCSIRREMSFLQPSIHASMLSGLAFVIPLVAFTGVFARQALPVGSIRLTSLILYSPAFASNVRC